MSLWSAENATKAYLRAITMGKGDKQPDAAEFISALAAGNNAHLMVLACADAVPGPTALALVAAAHQTGGRVICIVAGADKLKPSREALGRYADRVELVIGDAPTLLSNDDYKGADFVLVDCALSDHKWVFRAAQEGIREAGGLVVGYNALHKGPWGSESRTHFLPIGEGLLVSRVTKYSDRSGGGGGCGKRSRWVVKLDEFTGEEHVFRVTSPQRKLKIES